MGVGKIFSRGTVVDFYMGANSVEISFDQLESKRKAFFCSLGKYQMSKASGGQGSPVPFPKPLEGTEHLKRASWHRQAGTEFMGGDGGKMSPTFEQGEHNIFCPSQYFVIKNNVVVQMSWLP